MSGPVLSPLTIRTGQEKQRPARRPSLSAESIAPNEAKRQWSAVRSRWTVEQTNPNLGMLGYLGECASQCLLCETNPIASSRHNGQILGSQGVMTNRTGTGLEKTKPIGPRTGDRAGSVEPSASAVSGIYCAKRSQSARRASGGGPGQSQSPENGYLESVNSGGIAKASGLDDGSTHGNSAIAKLRRLRLTLPPALSATLRSPWLRTDSPLKSEAPGRYTDVSRCAQHTLHATCNN
jgi:hypothetical protein